MMALTPSPMNDEIADHMPADHQASASVLAVVPLTAGFRGDRIARRGRTAHRLWQAWVNGMCDGGGRRAADAGNGAAAAARTVRTQR
jgi:hypothetical protein